MRELDGREGNAPRVVEITAGDAGQRIDNFLLRVFKDVPRSRIYRILRRGEVRVDGGRVKPTHRLQAGQRVRLPPVHTAQGPPPEVVPEAVIERVEARVLYEDGDLIVINKPAGLAVHGGSGLRFGLIDALRQGRPNAPFLELAHRLDRDTSGCLVVAKQRPALRGLQDALREGTVDKYYLALVMGRWAGGDRQVEHRLRRHAQRGGERMVQVDDDGRRAISVMRARERLPGATLMEIELHTGRTHQIRVQAAELGHPVAGDGKYGDPGFNRRLRRLGLRRQFLHALRLALRLPGSGRPLTVEAPLDEDLSEVLAALRAEAQGGAADA